MSVTAAQAYKIYYDYHCNNNSLHTSDQEMGAIVSQYSDKIETWQRQIMASTDDVNEYDFDDSDYERYVQKGEDMGKDATGGHTKKDQAGDIAKATGDIAFAGASAGLALANGGIGAGLKNVGKGIGKVFGKEVGNRIEIYARIHIGGVDKFYYHDCGKIGIAFNWQDAKEKFGNISFDGSLLSIGNTYSIKKEKYENHR